MPLLVQGQCPRQEVRCGLLVHFEGVFTEYMLNVIQRFLLLPLCDYQGRLHRQQTFSQRSLALAGIWRATRAAFQP